MPERDANQLAADVWRYGTEAEREAEFFRLVGLVGTLRREISMLTDESVAQQALVGTLQQERDQWVRANGNLLAERIVAVDRAEAAEAALAEALRREDSLRLGMATAAETVRQALADLVSHYGHLMGEDELAQYRDLADTGGDTAKKPIPCSCDRRAPNWDARGYCWCGGYDPNRADTGGDTAEEGT